MGVLAVVAQLLAGVAMAAQPKLVDQVEVGNHPESATGDDKYIYVSNMGPRADMTKSGDGYISRLSLDGTLEEKVFLPVRGKLHSPMGMAVSRGMLYVNDIDRVIGFHLESRKQIVVVDLSSHGVNYLNDLVMVSATQAVVSATADQKLYLVDFARRISAELKVPNPLRHPNGLAFDSQQRVLYVAGNEDASIGKTDANGFVQAFRLHQKVSFAGTKGNLGKFVDGIAFVSGALLLTDWGGWGPDGKLVQIYGSRPQVYPLGLKGAADFHWHSPMRRLFIAQLTEGKVALIDF